MWASFTRFGLHKEALQVTESLVTTQHGVHTRITQAMAVDVDAPASCMALRELFQRPLHLTRPLSANFDLLEIFDIAVFGVMPALGLCAMCFTWPSFPFFAQDCRSTLKAHHSSQAIPNTYEGPLAAKRTRLVRLHLFNPVSCVLPHPSPPCIFVSVGPPAFQLPDLHSHREYSNSNRR